MVTITLSDHISKQIEKLKLVRESKYNSELKQYKEKLIGRQEKICTSKKEIWDSLKNYKISKMLNAIDNYVFTKLSRKPIPPQKELPSHAEIIQRAGKSGEQKVDMCFNSYFNNEWVLILGYKNYKGEIDRILVGPKGIFAIEIKNINGTISCDGDLWWKDKYDKYGNLCESNIQITDRGSRSPSRQLNDPTNILQSELNRYGVSHIFRMVLLTHEHSKIGVLKNITIDKVSLLIGVHKDIIESLNQDIKDIKPIIEHIKTGHKEHK